MDSKKVYEIGTRNEIWLTDDMVMHREDGPAYINTVGTKMWACHGLMHNSNGPAAIYPDGSVSYWYKGNYHSFEDWCKLTNKTEDEIVLLKLQYTIRKISEIKFEF